MQNDEIIIDDSKSYDTIFIGNEVARKCSKNIVGYKRVI